MKRKPSTLFFVALTAAFLFNGSPAAAQIVPGPDKNLSVMTGDQTECSIAKNPANKLQLFVLCNNDGPGLFAARSADGGANWVYPDPADKTIADGDASQGPAACCDPTLAWDTFGNLFIAYIDAARTSIVIIRSADGGATFTNLTSFGPFCFQCPDQPTIAVGSDPMGPVSVWIVWHKNTPTGPMVAHGAAVTGVGAVGAFGPELTVPGTNDCSYGDLAIAPSGAVVQTCQTPSTGTGAGTILANTKPDGLGPNPFGAAVAVTATNVAAFDFIPAQSVRSVDSEAGLAFDKNPASPHFGRLYLVYTQAPTVSSADTDILLRFSDNTGGMWSAPVTINDDASGRSQFLPRIASNDLSGNIAVCWHDCRNSAVNTASEIFCTLATPAGFPSFIGPNVKISGGASVSNGSGNERGDYSGLAYFQGFIHPAWIDSSNSTGDNPNGTANFEAYTEGFTGGAAANEGDPHITTIDGVHYDFQSSGEFVSLRDPGGLEIQTRQTAVGTTFFPGPNKHDGLATCVSVNSAVAARVGSHRVTYQPNLNGLPDPSGLQLRVDGALRTLDASGISFGPGGGSVRQSPNNGIQVNFPDGTLLVATPRFWSSQGKWYMNVNVFRTTATEGLMGAIASGGWLPALPDGTSMGPLPSSLSQRYDGLYHRFADAWRVTDSTSLFDYAPGTSTKTFTLNGWPKKDPPCVVPAETPADPVSESVAQQACNGVEEANARENCVFDVRATGETGFAQLYLTSQRLRTSVTSTTVRATTGKRRFFFFNAVTLTATVSPIAGNDHAAGSVQFFVDGRKSGAPVPLDAQGRAARTICTWRKKAHTVSAEYIPAAGSGLLASNSSVSSFRAQ